jgi:hypothetical protein
MTGPIITWVSGKSCYPVHPRCMRYLATDFLERCLSTSESSVDTTPHPPSPTPLLMEWTKSKLTSDSWRDALVAALNVSISFRSGSVRWLDIPLVWSLQPQDSRFIVPSAIVSK